jgi:uncharacterized iron-regulated membrane protein
LRKGKNPLIHDLHKTLGFYVLIPMLLMALTGLMMSFGWFRNGVDKIFNVQHSNVSIKSSIPANPNTKPLPLAYFIKKADELMECKDFRFTMLRDKKDDTVFAMGRNNKAFKLIKSEYIDFDQYTGEVLKHDRFENHHIGEKIVGISFTLHYGNILGLPTKIIYFIACLIATTLPVTGVIIWWRKLRNLRKTKNNQRKSAKSAD